MQNRVELKQIGHYRSKKNDMSREGKKYNFQKGGTNIVFRPAGGFRKTVYSSGCGTGLMSVAPTVYG